MKTKLTLLEKIRLYNLYKTLLAVWEDIKRQWRDEPVKKSKWPPRHDK